MLAEEPLPVVDRREVVDRLLELAGWAPFHRPCDRSHVESEGPGSIVPWRFHAIDAAGCRALREALLEREAGKIPAMLAAADALIQVTWLPTPGAVPEGAAFAPTHENMEHIAAASAAVQNLLVAATADGFASYWSSGGILRREEIFRWLVFLGGRSSLVRCFSFRRSRAASRSIPASCARDGAGRAIGAGG